MWKDNVIKKRLKNACNSTYLITGINFEVLLNRLKRQGVLVINAKKRGKKQLILTIKSKENQKLFAITKELCYNIKNSYHTPLNLA